MKKTILPLLVAVGLIGSAISQTPTGDLARGLMNFYSFNGNYNDSVGGNNFTSITAGVSFTNDRFGNANGAVQLESYLDSITTQNNLNLPTGSSFTISIWVKPSSIITPYNSGSLVQFGQLNADASNYGGVFGMQFWPSGRGGIVDYWGGYADAEHNNAFSEIFDDWHQLVYTYDGSVLDSGIYIDGSKVSTTSTALYTDKRNIVNTPLTVGNFIYSLNGNTSGGLPNSPFNNLGIWNRAISSSEVSSLYAAQSVPEPSTYALFGLGAIAMLMVMRRKKIA